MDKDKQGARRIAIFDFDGTLVKGDSIVSYLTMARQKGFLTAIDLLSVLWASVSYLLKLSSIEKSKSRALRFLKRMTQEQQKVLAEEFISTRLMPSLFPRGFKRMLMHEGQGDIILLVSASPAIYMGHLIRYLPVHAVLASPTEQDGTIRVNYRGDRKVLRVKQWLSDNNIKPDWENSYSYGNSLSDAPVMALTGHPIMISPRKSLAAQRSSWTTEDWAERTAE